MRLASVVTLCCLIALESPVPAGGQAGDAEYGRELLRMRGCEQCHAPDGIAPDLSKRPDEPLSPDAVAASLWNHAPRMWEALAERDLPHLGLLESDIANLYAYFYSQRHFDPPGHAEAGERVFAEKGCAGCHELEPVDDPTGRPAPDAPPPVDRWVSALDPTLWLESLWNHGAEMAARIERHKGEWPTFTHQEMLDLIAFIESRPAHANKLPYLRMGDWFAGQYAFRDLGCSECHTVGDPAEGKVDLLDLARRQPLLSGLAVEMWNHRQAMAAQAEAKGMELPIFEPDQMANVLAYLFRVGYFQAHGDAKRGLEAYRSLGCAGCHDGGESGAPLITNHPTPFSAIRLASAVWMHGPGMKAQMDYLGQDWPELTEQQVADLVAFIRNR